jgi:hypothetical protein
MAARCNAPPKPAEPISWLGCDGIERPGCGEIDPSPVRGSTPTGCAGVADDPLDAAPADFTPTLLSRDLDVKARGIL